MGNITVKSDGSGITVASQGPQGVQGLGTVDPTKLPLAGGTMSGDIDMDGNSILNDPAIDANTSKTGITAQQATDITTNNAKISYTDAAAVSLNTAKVTNATHTGDATGNTALVLATVNSDIGSFIKANITVNAKGLVTAAADGGTEEGFVVCEIADLAQFKTGSVYNLPVNRYFFCGDVNFGTDTINLNDTNGIYVFYGKNFNQLTYTGTGNFISTDKTGVSLNVIRLFMTSTTGTFINLSNGNSLIVEIPVFINCLQCVTLDTMGFCTGDKVAMIGCANGFTLDDVSTTSFQVYQWSPGTNANGVALTLLGAASNKLLMTGIDSEPASTECFIDIQATYGADMSMAVGVHTIGGGDFFAVGSRDQSDVDMVTAIIKNVPNSARFFSGHFTGNSTDTVISSSGVAVKIAGTWITVGVERFTFDSTGKATYIGKEDAKIIASVVATVEPSGGGEKLAALYIAINGTVVATSKGVASVKTGAQISSVAEVSISTGDTIESFIANEDDATNLLVSTISFNAR